MPRPLRIDIMHQALLGAFLLACLAPLACSAPVGDQLAEIRTMQDRGAFEESIEPLRELLAEHPDHGEANFLLGTALTQIGEPGNALFSLKRAAKDPAFGAQAGMMMASNLLATNNPEAAAEAAQEVTELEPDLLPGWILLAATQQRLRNWEEMLVAADRAIELAPAHLQAVGLRGVALFELGRLDESIAAMAELERETREAGDLLSAAKSCVSQAQAEFEKLQPESAEPGPLESAMAEAGDVRARVAKRNAPLVESEAVVSERAEAVFQECLERYPDREQVVEALAGYYEEVGQPEAARAVWAAATKRSPEILAFRLGEASHVWEQGDRDEAKRLVSLAADDFQTPQAYEELARMHRVDGELEEAANALSAAAELGGGSDRLRFYRAELFASAGELERAESLLAEVEEPTYRLLIEARIALAREQYREALDLYESALVNWPDNSGARYLAGLAAYQLGDFERALAEYRESIRSEPDDNPALLAGARLAAALGQYGTALSYVNLDVNGPSYDGPEIFLIGARTSAAMGKLDLADDYLEGLGLQEGGAPYALAERVALLTSRAGPDAAARFLDAVTVDWTEPSNLPVLQALVQVHIDRGTPLEVIDEIDTALGADAEAPIELLDLKGRILVAADRDAEARKLFEQVLALDPSSANAHEGLGVLAYRANDLETAVSELDRAVELQPDHEEAAYRAAQLVLATGDADAAITRLKQVVSRHPAAPRARNDLAYLLADRGEDLDTALELATTAHEIEGGPSIADTLAFVQLKRGEADAAIATLEKALGINPEVPTLRFRLGEALAQKGDVAAAQSAIKEALRFGAFPEAEQARAMLVRLEQSGSVPN